LKCGRIKFPETHMYIGGGLLGLILVVVLFVWLLRRV
jgi:flagellar biogenesis protein FliO